MSLIRKTLVIGAALALTASAANAGRHGLRGAGTIDVDRLSAKLDLSLEQADQLRTIQDSQVRLAIDTHAEISWHRHQLQQLIAASDPDRSAIDQKIDEIAALKAAQKKATVAAMLDGRAVLTEGQRAQLAELRDERRASRAERRGERHLRQHDRRDKQPSAARDGDGSSF